MPEEDQDPTAGPSGQPPTTPPTAEPPAAPSTPKSFTQDEVTSIATKEAAEAARRTTRQLLATLGFQNQDELAQWVSKTREAEKAQMTEAERKFAEASEKEAAAVAREATATATILNVSVKEALMDAGVPTKDAELIRAMVSVEPTASREDIASAVDDLKAKMPHLFGRPAGGGAPSSEPASGGAPAGGQPSLTTLDAGKARAAQLNAARGLTKTPGGTSS